MDTTKQPIPVTRALRKLGRDLRDARRRRRIPVAILAARASISRTTLNKIENGDSGVSFGSYATVLFVLGMINRLADLADPAHDALGRELDEERLPQRIRLARGTNRQEVTAMETAVLVYVELQGAPHLVGRLWTRVRKERESATFEYDNGWLRHPNRFSLEPALTLGPGPFHTTSGKPLFGAIGDSAPDRWGRVLRRRAARRRAERERKTVRTLLESDYLLMVGDEARQGALRFATTEGGPFLAQHGPQSIPPLIELPRLLTAAEHVVADSDTDEDLRLLLAPGSSLGGARPKASVRDSNGHLAIAKFPNKGDDINMPVWEAMALSLAAKAGIAVPDFRIEAVDGRSVLLLRRFDRDRSARIPFLSAMSMLGASDNESRSYLEFVDALRQFGASPKEDMHALWRRIVFSILISNTDDHLRNHGFLYSGPAGWRLAPAYDLNPVPVDIKPRVLSTAISLDDGTASLDLALEVAGYFELNKKEARKIASEVGRAVGTWRSAASRLGLSPAEVERMASAFEHRDFKEAVSK